MSQPDEAVATDGGTKYTPHPEGSHPARCVDCVNLGPRVEVFGGKSRLSPKLALVFRTGQRRDDGEWFEISVEFTISMNEKAGLRKFLEAWRGKVFTEDEAQAGVPVHKMVGVPALISVVHATSAKGRTYAKIGSVMRLPKGLEPPDTGEYQRAEYWAERKQEYAESARQFHVAPAPASKSAESFADFPEALADSDDDLPF